jgi:hypothetical protein
MVSRNGDATSFALGIIGSLIAFIALLLSCVGVGLPTWYVGTTANGSVTLTQANLFSACYVSNGTQATTSSKLTCVPYSSFSCSTSSYLSSRFNVTTYISGCTNPNNDSAIYYDASAPIYQITIDSFYRLRAAAALSLTSIVFILFSLIFGFLTGVILLNVYLAFIAPALATMAVIFGICGLVLAGSSFNYTGAGFALFTVGILLETIVILLFAIIAGRLNMIGIRKDDAEDESMFVERSNAVMTVRRAPKRRN